jgi:hypothetical protein
VLVYSIRHARARLVQSCCYILQCGIVPEAMVSAQSIRCRSCMYKSGRRPTRCAQGTGATSFENQRRRSCWKTCCASSKTHFVVGTLQVQSSSNDHNQPSDLRACHATHARTHVLSTSTGMTYQLGGCLHHTLGTLKQKCCSIGIAVDSCTRGKLHYKVGDWANLWKARTPCVKSKKPNQQQRRQSRERESTCKEVAWFALVLID